MQSSDEIIKEKQDSGKIKGRLQKGSEKVRENKIWMSLLYGQMWNNGGKIGNGCGIPSEISRRIHPGGENITKISFILVGK